MRLLPVNVAHARDSEAVVRPVASGAHIEAGGLVIGLWTSRPVSIEPSEAQAVFELRAGEAFWAVLGLEEEPSTWSAARVRDA